MFTIDRLASHQGAYIVIFYIVMECVLDATALIQPSEVQAFDSNATIAEKTTFTRTIVGCTKWATRFRQHPGPFSQLHGPFRMTESIQFSYLIAVFGRKFPHLFFLR